MANILDYLDWRGDLTLAERGFNEVDNLLMAELCFLDFSGIVPADFVGTVRNDAPYAENHDALLSNLLAQTEALANGQRSDDPHRAYPGNRPSTTILLDALTPQSLGALLALYEHSVYVCSVLWGINAFDQFGVELGKQVASALLPALRGESKARDPVTAELIARLGR